MDNCGEDNQACGVEEGRSKEKKPRIEAHETSDVSSSISSQVLGTDNDISIEFADVEAQQLLGMVCSCKQVVHARKICGNNTSIEKMPKFFLTTHDDFRDEGCSSSIPVHKWRRLKYMGFSEEHICAAIKACGKQSDTLDLVEYIHAHFCDDPFLPMQNKACLPQPEGCSMPTTVPAHEKDNWRHLLSMGFSEEHINTAIKACGQEIDTIELVEFIHAQFCMNDPKLTMNSEVGWSLPEGCSMLGVAAHDKDKWRHLKNMGFSEEHIKAAIEACGKDCDTIDLVEFIQAHFCINDPTFETKAEACSPLPEGCLSSDSTLEKGLGMRLKDMGFSDEHIEATIKACGKESSIEMALEYIQALCCAQESTFAEEKEVDSSEDEDISISTTFQKLRNIGFSHSAIGSAMETCESLDFEDLLNFLLEADSLCGEGLPVEDGCEISAYGCKGADEAGPSVSLATSMNWAEDKVKLWYSYIGTKKDHFLDLNERSGEAPWVEKSAFKAKRARTKKEGLRLEGTSKTLRSDRMRGFAMPGYFVGRPKPLPDIMVGPPFFYFENVAGTPKHEWDTIKRHLHGVDIEFTDSKYFSASRRPRGYVHNLPIDGRKVLVPEAPMTIAEALPNTQKYWPWWDTREKLNCINTRRASDTLCEMIRALCSEYDGVEMPLQRQEEILQVSKKWNVVWVGPGRVAPLEPHEMELLLGFDEDHTRGCSAMTDRYLALGNTFQVDTVGYHLSPLKALYSDGITVLSLFSGIGGAEVALHRLGIPLKAVVSVERHIKAKRVLENWWKKTKQRGKLNTCYNDVQDVSYEVLVKIVEEFGTIDLIIGGSPCNNLSGCNRVTRTGLEGKESGLFYEFPRILNLVKQIMRDRRPYH